MGEREFLSLYMYNIYDSFLPLFVHLAEEPL